MILEVAFHRLIIQNITQVALILLIVENFTWLLSEIGVQVVKVASL